MGYGAGRGPGYGAGRGTGYGAGAGGRYGAGTGSGYGAGLAAGAAAAWAPTDVAGLQVWLKADGTLWQDSARTTPVTADNDPVGAWDDASGNARHATQATAGKRPLYKTAIQNGKPVIRFDNTDDSMAQGAYAFGTAATIFLVAKLGTGSDYVVSGSGAASIPAIISGFGGVSYEWFSDTDRQTFSAGATGINILVARQSDGATLKGAFNGSDVFSVVPGVALSGKSVAHLGSSTGAADFYGGDLCEFGIYDTSISDANLALLFTYLNTRWAAY